jgi:hypothetical protein
VRGLLYILLLAGAVCVLGVYVLLPAAADGMMTMAVGAAGLQAPDTVVRVRSDPPWDLVGLHADTVQVRATGATFRGYRVDSVAFDLGNVSLLDRTAKSVAGRLDGLVLPDIGPKGLRLATVTLSGSGGAITATSLVASAAAQVLIADAVQATLGRRPTAVELATPDRVTVHLGSDVTGTISVLTSGRLVIHVEGGAMAGQDLVVLGAGAGLPFTLTSVTVTPDGGLRVVGDLAGGLLG